MENISKPFFREVAGNVITPPPYRFKNIKTSRFIFKSNLSPLTTVCHRFFDPFFPEKEKLHVLAPLVVLSCTTYCAPPSKESTNMSGYDFNEVSFDVFISVPGRHGVEYAFTPYVFTNNIMVMCSGREVLGVPYSLGWIDIPERFPLAKVVVEAVTLEKFQPAVQAGKQTILTLTGPPSGSGTSAVAGEELHSGFGSILHEHTVQQHSVQRLLRHMTGGEVPYIALKQFRDFTTQGISYQSVVDYRHTWSNLRHLSLLDASSCSLDFSNSDMYPIHKDLGLTEKGNTPLMAFQATMDLNVEGGKELLPA